MAVYRHIHIDYWQDGFVLDLTPEEKYFYIYLMTNSKTSQCGIYELPKRIIETETGYNRETVDKLLNRFIEYKKIVYCEETREVFLMNWIKHNKIVSPKVKKCVYEELKKIKSMDMVNLFFKQCEGYGYTLDKSEIKINMGMDRVSIPIPEVENNFEYGYGEKEKEKQKEKEKKEEKEKEEEPTYSVGRFKKLYEQNIGLINGIVAEWLFEISELIDYNEVKFGERNDGVIYGVYSFSRKIGQALAGGLGGYALGFIGFNAAAQEQTTQVLDGIYALATLFPAVCYGIVALIMLLGYPLSKKVIAENGRILEEKRANH